MDEGERWFHLTQERNRERDARARRAKRRVERATQRKSKRQQGANPNIKMEVSEWEVDEHGVLSRTVTPSEGGGNV